MDPYYVLTMSYYVLTMEIWAYVPPYYVNELFTMSIAYRMKLWSHDHVLLELLLRAQPILWGNLAYVSSNLKNGITIY